jgi:ATP-dependent Lon protease
VVRKDLVRKVKVGANVPVFVLEYLLGKYCASSDEMAIQMGLQVVNDTLADNYIRPDESMKAQSKVKENGRSHLHRQGEGAAGGLRLLGRGRRTSATTNVHIPDHYVRDFDRLLTGGIWAQVDMRFEYDEETRGKNPFWIEKLTPIQLATFDLEEYRRLRKEFTTEEWLDFILRSMGYEPTEMERRLKLLFLLRLIPLCERTTTWWSSGRAGPARATPCRSSRPTPRC